MLFLFSLFFTYSFFCQAIPLIAGLEGIQQKQWDQIQEWLKLPEGSRDLEVRYQRLVQKQVFLDLLKLYAPENGAQVKVTYASFTPDLYWKT